MEGHNSHTNICSSGARAGYHFWLGMDRPSPDHANARVMLLVSSHLEAGHYFNPHALRIMEAKASGAKLIVLDPRLSNTATHADHWLSPYPGSEAAIFLAIAHCLVKNRLHNRDFVRRWWNWQEYMAEVDPDVPATFEAFESALEKTYAEYTFEYAAKQRGGSLDVYLTPVYNPVWTDPDGFSWIELLSDPERIGLHVALTPTWNETAYFADYVLPMGLASERHDTHSYEQYDGQWVGFRQPVLRAARERLGESVTDTREVNPGEVWEENEFWIDLTWRIDPDGQLGIRSFFESRKNPGEPLTVDEYSGALLASGNARTKGRAR